MYLKNRMILKIFMNRCVKKSIVGNLCFVKLKRDTTPFNVSCIESFYLEAIVVFYTLRKSFVPIGNKIID